MTHLFESSQDREPLLVSLKEIGKYLQTHLLEANIALLFEKLSKFGSSGSSSTAMDTEKGDSKNANFDNQAEEQAIKHMRLLRCHFILFAKFFECEDSQTPGSFEAAKLASIDHLKVEALFEYLKLDLTRLSLVNVSKKLFREAENLIYCCLSGLLNYFIFLKDSSKAAVTINAQFLAAAEQPLLSIVAAVAGGKIDVCLFEHVTGCLAKLIMVLVDLCQPAAVKQVIQLTPEVHSYD